MAEFGPDIGNTVTQLLGRTAMLVAENRALQDDQRRLLAALGSESVDDAVEIAEALMAFYTENLPDDN